MIFIFKKFMIFALINTLSFILINTIELDRKEIEVLPNMKCIEGEFLSHIGCVTKCPSEQEYSDEFLQICTTETNCSEDVPFSDPATKKCVSASNCHVNNPFGDTYSKKCVSAHNCHASTPFGDKSIKSCVSAENCSRYILDASADEYTRLCIVKSKKLFDGSLHTVTKYSNRELFSLKGSESNTSVENLISMQNSVKTLLNSLLKVSTLQTYYNKDYGSFKISIINSTNHSIESMIGFALNEFTPYTNYKSCVKQLNYGVLPPKTYLIAQIIWGQSIISSLTLGKSNSTGIYSVIYDVVSKTILKCESLDTYLPDPVYHNINTTDLYALYSMNVNPYNNTEPFYNDRCYQYTNQFLYYDITLNMRRQNLMSKATLSCLNLDTSSAFVNNQDCIFSGVTQDGYMNCNCGTAYSEVFLGSIPYDYKPSDNMVINLDILKCYRLTSYYEQPYHNVGVYFTLVSFGMSFFISILVKFLYTDSQLIKKYTEDILYNDSKTNGNGNTLISNSINRSKGKEIQIMGLKGNKLENQAHINNFVTTKDREIFEEINELKITPRLETEENATGEKSYTIAEYFRLSTQDKLTLDKRSFRKYLFDQLTSTHILFIFFFKKSVLISPIVRWFQLCNYFNLIFLLNAMLYTDDYIEARSSYSDENYWVYVWTKEIPKSVFVCLLIVFPMTVLNLLVSSYGKFLSLNSDVETSREGISKLLTAESKKHTNSVYFRRAIFIVISVLLILFSFYYVILFSGVYYYSQLGWFYAGIASLILDLVGIMILLPLIGSVCRNIAIGNKSLRWMIHFTKIDYFNYFIHN